MTYKVTSINHTSKLENNFNNNYHEKYINKTGKEIKHNLKPNKWSNAILLGLEYDKNGRLLEADWFHMFDLQGV